MTEVVKQIAKMWQSLSKEEKQRYKEAAKEGKNWTWGADGLMINLDKERYGKELKELARSNKTLNKPKKPLTPYMLFVREVSRLSYFCKMISKYLHLDKAESGQG